MKEEGREIKKEKSERKREVREREGGMGIVGEK